MGPGMRWVQERPPGALTSITPVTWSATMPAGATKGTVLETDDPDGDGLVLQETTGGWTGTPDGHVGPADRGVPEALSPG